MLLYNHDHHGISYENTCRAYIKLKGKSDTKRKEEKKKTKNKTNFPKNNNINTHAPPKKKNYVFSLQLYHLSFSLTFTIRSIPNQFIHQAYAFYLNTLLEIVFILYARHFQTYLFLYLWTCLLGYSPEFTDNLISICMHVLQGKVVLLIVISHVFLSRS